MVNWGIIGLGKMGFTFAQAIEETNNSRLVATASKSGKSIKNIKNFSYEDLIRSDEIDAIYISTLNNTHIDLIKQIASKGKKILCEKPVSLSLNSLTETENLLKEKKIQFYEAIAYYSHPQTLELLKLIKEAKIGEIKSIESNFGFKCKFKEKSRLFNKILGGGSVFDLGCYPISFFMLFAEDFKKISTISKKVSFAKNGVDDEAELVLDYNNKFIGKLKVSLKSNYTNNCVIKCTNGYIKIKEPWLPNKKANIEVLTNNHYYLKTINSKLSVYANQIHNVSESFLNPEKKNNLFNINKSIINMKLITEWLNNY